MIETMPDTPRAEGIAVPGRPGRSPPQADPTAPPNLSDVADELYGLPPDEFIAWDARRKAARTDGDRELAQAIGKLRTPTATGSTS